eukprot:CAMPEP_0181293388 /NCGR_PEP_ID=MMETSP1101-20121128/3039_1 /TAXON_ID=46948 /ORGANISM="Rhodomonas abbreviata, Strain Caron Lab Isolate" /LENGTH=217 /DNA_ID=CAMNT_0023397973 /DNA_START=292 /DNA_END=942 /DNA_ORIENTATION=-
MAADMFPTNSIAEAVEVDSEPNALNGNGWNTEAATTKGDTDIEGVVKSILNLYSRIHSLQEADISSEFRCSVDNCQNSEDFSLILHQMLSNAPKSLILDPKWEQKGRRKWETQCFQCRSMADLMALISELDGHGISWSAMAAARTQDAALALTTPTPAPELPDTQPMEIDSPSQPHSAAKQNASDMMEQDCAASPLSPSGKDGEGEKGTGSTVSRYG